MTGKNIKRVLLISVAFLALITCYYVTRSLIASLCLIAGLVLYGAWVIIVESGFWNHGQNKKQLDEAYKANKKAHLKRTEDNPTLR